MFLPLSIITFLALKYSKPPEVPLEHQLQFSVAESNILKAQNSFNEARAQLQSVTQLVLKDCPTPWVPSKDDKSGHIVCVLDSKGK